LLLGAVARCVRYCLRFPLWEDECFLCVNYMDRDYLGLLEPLQYHQVAPPLFLWIELTLSRLLGFSEWSLRLFPFVCSVTGLLLFRRLAGRLLGGLPLLLAVATFACAYSGIRYSAEAKQYASDQFVSLVLLTLAVGWWQQPADRWRLWALAAIVPVAVWLSYPAVFVAGGVSLAAAAVLWASPGRRGWVAWTAYNSALLVGFGGLYLAAASRQSQAELAFMGGCWQEGFPPISEPARLPLWLLRTHASDLLAYPIGGEKGASSLTFLCFVAGLAFLAWRRRGLFLLLALAPFALHLTAAALGRYPYGGHMKFGQHLGPIICLLAGLGGATWLGLLARARLGRAGLVCGLLLSFGVAAGSIARDIWQPYKTFSDERARSFARWFWFNAEFEGEAVCLKTDLAQDFAPGTYRELSWSAMYLCNQRIYSPRHAAGLGPRLERVTAERPLRCVLYRDPDFPCDEARLQRWLVEMQGHYQLVAHDVYAFPRYAKGERRLVKVDHVQIFTLVPQQRQAAYLPHQHPPTTRPAMAAEFQVSSQQAPPVSQ
jgi:hypothetical protein